MQPQYSYPPVPQYAGAPTAMPQMMPQPGMPQPGMPQPCQQQPCIPPQMPQGYPPQGYYPTQPGMVQPGMMAPCAPQMQVLSNNIYQRSGMTQMEAEDFAAQLYGAFKGIGANHSEVIRILSSHNKLELSAIAAAYYMKYGQTLEKRVASEMTGNYERLSRLILSEPFKMEASELSKAVKAEDALIAPITEILTTRTQADLLQIFTIYSQPKYNKKGKIQKQKKSLANELLSKTKGWRELADLVRNIITTQRPMIPVDETRAKNDAQDLIMAAKGLGTDEAVFVDIMTHRSFEHLRQVAVEVEKQKKKPLKNLICSEFSGFSELALCYITFMAQSPAHAQAYMMYRAMKGIGTRDGTLIRCIAYIYDNDMLDEVKKAFKEITGKDLVKEVEKETSLNYSKLCVALLNFKGNKLKIPMNNNYK